MNEQIKYLDLGHDKIACLDADEQGNFIVYTEGEIVITNNQRLTIDINLRFPLIRRMNNDTFLIADCRTGNSPNGHIYDFTGTRIKSFVLGDGIQDIVIQYQKIVVAYFDEGVAGEDGPN